MMELLTWNNSIWPKMLTACCYDVLLVSLIAICLAGMSFKQLFHKSGYLLVTILLHAFFNGNKIFIDIMAYLFLVMILFKLLNRKNWFETLNLFSISFGASFIIWTCIKLIFSGAFLQTDPFGREVILRTFAVGSGVLLGVCLPAERLFVRIQRHALSLRLISHNIMLIAFAVVVMMRLNIQLSFLASVLILLGLIIMNGYVYSSFKVAHQQQLIAANNKSSEVFEELIFRMRSSLHEEKNRIQAISMLPDLCEDYDDLKQAINTYTVKSKENKALGRFLNIRRKFVAALIVAKAMEAEQKKLSFEVEIQDYAMTAEIDDYQLSEIFGTLLDNAFEAVTEQPDKTISLRVFQQFDSLVIEVKNPCRPMSESEIKKCFSKGYTTKENQAGQRGIGLYNLSRIVSSYGGTALAYTRAIEEQNYIIFKIML